MRRNIKNQELFIAQSKIVVLDNKIDEEEKRLIGSGAADLSEVYSDMVVKKTNLLRSITLLELEINRLSDRGQRLCWLLIFLQ